jgi:creatinine amidohydrolase
MKSTLLLFVTLFLCSFTSSAQVYRLAEMNTTQIKNLNRDKTVVLIPGGILEEHGPFLPSFTDGYFNEQLTKELAKAISAKPGWSVVVFPTIPLGNSGANDVGGKFSFPGTYAVRFNTLRSMFMDLATELGEQKFKWVFVVHFHGAPNHNRALDQAGDYFRDTYNGRMVNLTGLVPVIAGGPENRSDDDQREDGMQLHSGLNETSMMLALRPDLVNPDYKNAKSFPGAKMEDLIQISRRKDWLGYFGAPRLARAEYYASGWQTYLNAAINIADKILNGLDERTIIRFGDEMKKSAADVRLDKESLKNEAEIERKQQLWLKKQNLQ